MGSIPDPGRPHLPQSNSAPAPQILRLSSRAGAHVRKDCRPHAPEPSSAGKTTAGGDPHTATIAARVPVKTPRSQKYISKILKKKKTKTSSQPHYHSQTNPTMKEEKIAKIMSFSSPYSLSPATSHDQLLSPRCNWVEWGAHAPLLLYFQFLINDIIAEPSSNLGVIFIIRNGMWQS